MKTFTFSKTLTFSVYDRIGAGDAYTSGIIYGELEGFSPEKTVSFAASSRNACPYNCRRYSNVIERDILRAMTEAVDDVER